MAIHKLTDLKIKAKIRAVEALSFSPNPKNALVGDGQGLYLSISKSGTASWLFRYMDHGKARTVGLGGYPSTSLQKAREKAQLMRDARTGGIDPALAKKKRVKEEKLQIAKAMTFETCALEFIEFKRSSWSNAKHAQQWTNTLTQYAFPVIGRNSISDVEADDIVKIVGPIWHTKHETADRVLQRIRAILDYSKVQGWRDGENPARWKGHMEYLLSDFNGPGPVHHPSLPYDMLPAFMKSLQQQSGMTAYALEFLILCASRTSEVTDARWDEFDLKKNIWTIPANRMKAGVTHRVPLGKRALKILEIIRPFSGKKHVFVTGKKDVPMSSGGMSSVLKRMKIENATVHGMRSTYRDWAGEKTNYPFEVCEHALAHGLPDDVAAAYLRSDFYVKRVNLMKSWAAFALSGCDS